MQSRFTSTIPRPLKAGATGLPTVTTPIRADPRQAKLEVEHGTVPLPVADPAQDMPSQILGAKMA